MSNEVQWSVVVEWPDGPKRHYASGPEGAMDRVKRREAEGMKAHIEVRRITDWQLYDEES